MAERDLAFEALAEVTNTDWNVGRGELNAALKQIRDQEPTEIALDGPLLAGLIYDKARAYREFMGEGIALTPTALAKHWQRVQAQAPGPYRTISPSPGAGGSARCGTCNGDKLVLVRLRPSLNPVSGYEEYAPCPDCTGTAA